MIKKIKSLFRNTRIFQYLRMYNVQHDDHVQESIRCLALEIHALKISIKRNKNINVIFVCQSPSSWGSFDSAYKEMISDPTFNVTIVVAPMKHSVYGDNEYHEIGMAKLLKNKGYKFIYGYNPQSTVWVNLQQLSPDYVFFVTPYNSHVPFIYTSEYVSLFAKVCYIPYYGTLIYRGAVDSGAHPINFFKHVSFYFVTHELEKEGVLERLRGVLRPENVVTSGSPKTDYIFNHDAVQGNNWKLGINPNLTKILWCTRWVTSDGTCHFFDYRDYFLEFAELHPNVDILFRPHPLSFKNFLKTGELSQEEYEKMIMQYDNSQNAKIDNSNEYHNTFMIADFLVSDMSSILFEYFLTGKPIIYTHRKNTFNEFGAKIASGFYWVTNQDELDKTMKMLLKGEDPKKTIRQKLMKDLLLNPLGKSASKIIIETLKQDYDPSFIHH